MDQLIRGSGGAPGVALGAAYVYQPATDTLAHEALHGEVALAAFEGARAQVGMLLRGLAERMRGQQKPDEAQIFEAQALMAEDPLLDTQIRERIAGGLDLLAALNQTVDEIRAAFEALDDAYLRERAADIGAIGAMLRQALSGESASLASVPANSIVIAPDLTPAETADLPADRIAGFVTAYGGPTGHTAILARSLGIPAVVGAGEAVLAVAPGTSLALDGDAGTLLVNPAPATIAQFEQRSAELAAARVRQQALAGLPGATADGRRVALWANIGQPAEVIRAREAGAEGIGLFRTEFLFLHRQQQPDEQEQFAAYRQVLEQMDGRPVVVRTLDIGGDKPLPYLQQRPEPNPFLGVRGLRFCMVHVDLFQTQLRALLRAAVFGDLWVMLPMVSTLADLAWAKEQINAAAAALAAAGLDHRADLPVGIMIETPAAAITADLFASQVAFFSIGSNDLTQYTLAADRGNGDLAQRYDGNATAVWRLIAQTIAAGKAAGIPVGVCGDLAGHSEAAVALAGLGISELSMAPVALLPVRERLRQVTLAEAEALGRGRL